MAVEAVIWTDQSVTWKNDIGEVLTTAPFPTIKEAQEFAKKVTTVPIKSVNVKGIK